MKNTRIFHWIPAFAGMTETLGLLRSYEVLWKKNQLSENNFIVVKLSENTSQWPASKHNLAQTYIKL